MQSQKMIAILYVRSLHANTVTVTIADRKIFEISLKIAAQTFVL